MEDDVIEVDITENALTAWRYVPETLFWEARQGGTTLVIEPAHRIGEALVGFRVTAWVESGGPGETITATIQRLDADSAAGTLTQETLAAAVEWNGLVDTEPTLKSVILQTEVLGSVVDRWFLQLFTTVAGGFPVFRVSHVAAVFRVVEL